MRRRGLPVVALALLAVGAGTLWLGRGDAARRYTGFVEGEERVLRSEVAGRVLAVHYAEGDGIPAGGVVATVDPSEVEARMASKRQELAVAKAQVERQLAEVRLLRETWERDVAAREAELHTAEAEARLATRTFARTESLHGDGVVSPQRLDEASAQRDARASALERARDLLAQARARQGEITLAERQVEVLEEQRELAQAQLAELEVLRARHDVRAPAVPTVAQTQLLWPGELAQPGTPVLSVLDPRDKYVQMYVPVADVDLVRVGTRVEIELDSAPGRRVPGEVTFVADEANFTPEKIETRSDRLGQVYRAKVRILEDVERFQPGTEGNVYLVDGATRRAARATP